MLDQDTNPIPTTLTCKFQRIPGTVQIGAVPTYGDVMSGQSGWQLQSTIVSLLIHLPTTPPRHFLTSSQENPTVKELYEHIRQEMQNTGPSESGPIHSGTRALAIRLPNNGFPEGSCAGRGAAEGKAGGALQQCARCKGRKYCGRACQKMDWAKHKSDCARA